MEKFKTYGSLFLSLMAAFILGAYAMSVKYEIKPVDSHQWCLTILIGTYFLLVFIDRIKNLKK